MVYTLRFFLQNAVCFIILTYLVLVLFTFYIQSVLKLKKKIIPAPKSLSDFANLSFIPLKTEKIMFERIVYVCHFIF